MKEGVQRGVKAVISNEMPAAGARLTNIRPATAVSNVACLGGPKISDKVPEDPNMQLFRDVLAT